MNRGFLFGPWLPIYGSGAIVILLATLPVRENPALIFLFGMISATVLEYVTGAVMERVFHARYRDYSNQPLNLRGYICIPVSLLWGLFSLLLVLWVHRPIEWMAAAIPDAIADPIGLCLTVLFVIDATHSVQAALGLKGLMEKLAGNNKFLAGAETRLQEIADRFYAEAASSRSKLEDLGQSFTWGKEKFQETRSQKKASRQEYLLDKLAERREKRPKLIVALLDKSNAILEDVDYLLARPNPEQDRFSLHNIRQNILDFQASLRKLEWEMELKRDAQYRRAAAILRRNPAAVSRKHPDVLEELKNLRRKN